MKTEEWYWILSERNKRIFDLLIPIRIKSKNCHHCTRYALKRFYLDGDSSLNVRTTIVNGSAMWLILSLFSPNIRLNTTAHQEKTLWSCSADENSTVDTYSKELSGSTNKHPDATDIKFVFQQS